MFVKNSSFNALYISNVAKTHDFYRFIGAEIEQLEDDKVVVNIGGFNLHFILENTEPFEEYLPVTKKEGRGQGNLHYIESDNIQETFDLIKKSTGILKSEIKDNHWNGKEFMFEDPDGYKFVVYQMI